MNQVMQFFRWEHLPPHLQEVSKLFAELAEKLHGMNYDERLRGNAAGLSGYDYVKLLSTRLEKELPKNFMSELCLDKMKETGDACVEAYPLQEILISLLEAKDCAVRTALFKDPEG